MRPIIIFRYLVIAMLVLFFSCDQNRVFENNINIPDGIWNVDNRLSFDVNMVDTISSHDIFLNVRHTSFYPYQNLFLFVVTTAPPGAAIKDTFECILADHKGKWYGSGLGEIWDNQILFKKNVRFPSSGLYNVEIEQAMRRENLPFVMDVGIRVEKVDN